MVKHIMVVPIDEDYHDRINKSQFDDACPICFQPLSGHGMHQVSCLPCGHIYGLYCIKKWLLLQTSSSGAGKCPQCNRLCTYKDVILLYAGAHQKVASSTRYFPFTNQGFIDFKKHEWLWHLEAKKKLTIDSQLLVDILELMRAIAIRRPALLTQWKDLEEQMEDQTEQPTDALQQQAGALKQQADALGERYDVLGRRADVLEQRTDVLGLRYDAYWPSLKFFKKMYKEHLVQQKK